MMYKEKLIRRLAEALQAAISSVEDEGHDCSDWRKLLDEAEPYLEDKTLNTIPGDERSS